MGGGAYDASGAGGMAGMAGMAGMGGMGGLAGMGMPGMQGMGMMMGGNLVSLVPVQLPNGQVRRTGAACVEQGGALRGQAICLFGPSPHVSAGRSDCSLYSRRQIGHANSSDGAPPSRSVLPADWLHDGWHGWHARGWHGRRGRHDRGRRRRAHARQCQRLWRGRRGWRGLWWWPRWTRRAWRWQRAAIRALLNNENCGWRWGGTAASQSTRQCSSHPPAPLSLFLHELCNRVSIEVRGAPFERLCGSTPLS